MTSRPSINIALSSGEEGKLTPKREILLFPLGTTATARGDMHLTEEDLAAVMESYRRATARRDGWLDIDYAHNSRTPRAEVEAHLSAGRFRLEAREDGLWATDITYTSRALAHVEAGEFWSFSPVVGLDDDWHIREISQIALTNIPASTEAGVLAASQVPPPNTESLPMKKYPLAALGVLLLSAADMGYQARMEAVREAASSALNLGEDSWAYVEEIYDDRAIVCAHGLTGPGGASKIYEIPYSIDGDGKAILGEMVEVIKVFRRADGGETAPRMATETQMQEAAPSVADEAMTELLSLTKTKSPGQALIAAQAALRDAQAKPALEKRLGELETREFTREREVLLSQAKRVGKWTKTMEQSADDVAAMAQRLGENRVAALSAFWDRAPVVTPPSDHKEPPVPPREGAGSTVMLSAADREAITTQLRHFPGLKREVLEQKLLDEKRRIAGRA